jgi:hypothetical protein
MTGRRVLAALGLILLATAVLPPAAAWRVNLSRVRVASAEVAALADILRSASPELRNAARGSDVLYGPGRVPSAQTPATARWVAAPRAAFALVVGDRHALSSDPWGNGYVVNLSAIAAAEPTSLWVLSAGPNGIIDTPFVSSSGAPTGDDVAIRVR